ncbi:hypothetical protein ARAM_006156 [Aspergillus rambellii]|uniref:Mitotic-spindle organizing protein 1 n=1 Tax=Aspergillus rambellii TaxID=308745 RepID=A0A0F8WX28_9EURO|nr:hypothetical protein ARAM_006156 [Aspergillus rambellii]
MPPQSDDKRQAAREVIDILHEISTLLVRVFPILLNSFLHLFPSVPTWQCSNESIQNTNLDRTELSLCVSLIENGVNPDALATVIKDLRKEAVVASRGLPNEASE